MPITAPTVRSDAMEPNLGRQACPDHRVLLKVSVVHLQGAVPPTAAADAVAVP
jgi:hypothetical protein